ncbi:MAG: hypothetical protein QM817_36760 [Archangium sp.]
MLTVLMVLVASATPAKKEVTLAAPGLTYVGITEQQGDVYLDYFAQQVTKRGVHVITRNDITAALGLERQKQLLGCTQGESNCIAELAGALGVSALVVGSIATAGSGFVVNLKVMEPSGSTRALAIFSERVPNEDALYALLEKSAVELGDILKPKVQTTSTTSARSLAWIPLGVGLLSGAAGGVLFGVAKGTEGSVANADPSITSLAQARARLGDALGLQTAALITGGIGLGALLAAGAMALFGGSAEQPAVSLQISSTGAGLVFSWGIP